MDAHNGHVQSFMTVTVRPQVDFSYTTFTQLKIKTNSTQHIKCCCCCIICMLSCFCFVYLLIYFKETMLWWIYSICQGWDQVIDLQVTNKSEVLSYRSVLLLDKSWNVHVTGKAMTWSHHCNLQRKAPKTSSYPQFSFLENGDLRFFHTAG